MRKMEMLVGRSARAAIYTEFLYFGGCLAAHAQYNATTFGDVETKYIFGFTEGSGIGLEGEKEFSFDTQARMGKKDGRYWASESKLEYEFTPNQYVQFELGPLVSAHSIKGVTNLENRSDIAFGGFFGEMRYQL